MIIIKIIVFILLFVFVMGMLGGMGLLGIANHIKRQFEAMRGEFTGHKTNPAEAPLDAGDLDLEECPHCGTYTEKNNYCEACGKSW